MPCRADSCGPLRSSVPGQAGALPARGGQPCPSRNALPPFHPQQHPTKKRKRKRKERIQTPPAHPRSSAPAPPPPPRPRLPQPFQWDVWLAIGLSVLLFPLLTFAVEQLSLKVGGGGGGRGKKKSKFVLGGPFAGRSCPCCASHLALQLPVVCLPASRLPASCGGRLAAQARLAAHQTAQPRHPSNPRAARPALPLLARQGSRRLHALFSLTAEAHVLAAVMAGVLCAPGERALRRLGPNTGFSWRPVFCFWPFFGLSLAMGLRPPCPCPPRFFLDPRRRPLARAYSYLRTCSARLLCRGLSGVRLRPTCLPSPCPCSSCAAQGRIRQEKWPSRVRDVYWETSWLAMQVSSCMGVSHAWSLVRRNHWSTNKAWDGVQ